MERPTPASPSSSCLKCAAPSAEAREVCVPCAVEIRDSVGKELMRELGRYWDRRLIEGHKKDWT